MQLKQLVSCNFLFSYHLKSAMADLQTKVSGTPSPQQDQNLSFLHVFLPKSAHVGGWRPLQRGLAPHKREILDPPLISTAKAS